MTLEAIADEYAASLIPLRARMRELRERIKVEEDPIELAHLQARYNALRPILRETRELASYCKHYYEWSGCNGGQQAVRHKVERMDRRYDGMEADDCGDERRAAGPPQTESPIRHEGRADSASNRHSGNEHLPGPKHDRNRKRAKRECIYNLPHIEAGKETLTEGAAIFLLSQIFKKSKE